MFVILDIDQDFFFYPPYTGRVTEARNETHNNMNTTSKSDIITIEEKSCPYHEFNYTNHPWNGKVDLVYYTLSPEWAPINSLIEEFKQGMKHNYNKGV